MAQEGRVFRACVVGVFQNPHGQILVCERSDIATSWQLPQGGIDEGETPERALKREMTEELGSRDFYIVRRALGTISYEFPRTLDTKIAQKYVGQEQSWFLLEFDTDAGPNLDLAISKEFRDYRWVHVEDAISLAVDWKRDAYRQGFRLLGLTR